ncbi:MAG: hypothetical protein AAFW46_07965 [Pseudomonadota bacterium]
MSRREYKTVAMPQIVKGRRRMRQSRAEMIAELLSGVINRQAQQGWAYVRADTFRTLQRRTWFHRSEEVAYTVLVFEREARVEAAAAAAPRRDAAPAPESRQPQRTPQRTEPAAPASLEALIAAPAGDLRSDWVEPAFAPAAPADADATRAARAADAAESLGRAEGDADAPRPQNADPTNAAAARFDRDASSRSRASHEAGLRAQHASSAVPIASSALVRRRGDEPPSGLTAARVRETLSTWVDKARRACF